MVVMVWAALLIGQGSCSRQSRAYKEFLPPVVRPQQEQVTIRFSLIFGDIQPFYLCAHVVLGRILQMLCLRAFQNIR